MSNLSYTLLMGLIVGLNIVSVFGHFNHWMSGVNTGIAVMVFMAWLQVIIRWRDRP